MGLDIFYILIVIFDILISIWNAYNAGKALEYMKLNNIESDWPRMVAYSTLILSLQVQHMPIHHYYQLLHII